MRLTAKLTGLFLVLLAGTVMAVMALAIDRTLEVMVSDLHGSGDRLTQEIFEQMRAALAHPTGDAVTTLRNDRGLYTLLESSLAFGQGVLYVRVVAPDGRIVVSPQHAFEGAFSPTAQPFDDLYQEVKSWVPLSALPALWGDRTYELSRPVEINGQLFANIKVGLSTILISNEVHHLIAVMLGSRSARSRSPP